MIRSAFRLSAEIAASSSSETGARSVFEITIASAIAAWRAASAKRTSVAAPCSASTTVTTRVMVVSPVLGSILTRMSCSAP